MCWLCTKDLRHTAQPDSQEAACQRQFGQTGDRRGKLPCVRCARPFELIWGFVSRRFEPRNHLGISGWRNCCRRPAKQNAPFEVGATGPRLVSRLKHAHREERTKPQRTGFATNFLLREIELALLDLRSSSIWPRQDRQVSPHGSHLRSLCYWIGGGAKFDTSYVTPGQAHACQWRLEPHRNKRSQNRS